MWAEDINSILTHESWWASNTSRPRPSRYDKESRLKGLIASPQTTNSPNWAILMPLPGHSPAVTCILLKLLQANLNDNLCVAVRSLVQLHQTCLMSWKKILTIFWLEPSWLVYWWQQLLREGWPQWKHSDKRGSEGHSWLKIKKTAIVPSMRCVPHAWQ